MDDVARFLFVVSSDGQDAEAVEQAFLQVMLLSGFLD